MSLRALPAARPTMQATLVIPPASPLQADTEIRQRLAALDDQRGGMKPRKSRTVNGVSKRLGQDGHLRYASGAQLEGELASAGIGGETRAAQLAGDATRLEALLGARANVCCLIVVPDGEADPSAR